MLVNWIVAAGLVLLTAVVYAQVAGFEFTNYDDTAYVPDNSHVRDGFSLRNIGWAFTTFETANWYPLTWLSLMLECQLFGPRPGVTHAVNALFHAANTVLLFAALRRMTGRRWPSAAVAALFAVHPLHVESVAWVSESQGTFLSTFFFLLTLLAYERYAARPGVGRYSLVLLSMAAGLLCKPMLVTLPFVLLLLDLWPLKRFVGWTSESVLSSPDGPGGPSYIPSTVPRLILEKLPLLALSIGAAIVTMVAQAEDGSDADDRRQDRPAAAVEQLRDRLRQIPCHDILAVRFGGLLSLQLSPLPSLVAEATVILAALTLLCLYLLRRAPYLAVGWFWYLGTLVPTIGLVQVGRQGLADRYNYIPSIGIYLTVVWIVADLGRWADFQSATKAADFKSRPLLRPAAAAFAFLTATLAVSAHQQTAYWINSERLFRHALAVTGDNPESCENLGDALLHRDQFAEAETELRKVLAMASAEEFRQTPGELAPRWPAKVASARRSR